MMDMKKDDDMMSSHGNTCGGCEGGCGMGGCSSKMGCGCGGWCGGTHKYGILRIVLLIVIVLMVFSLGVKIGEFKAEFGGGYGPRMMQGGYYGGSMMDQNGYYGGY